MKIINGKINKVIKHNAQFNKAIKMIITTTLNNKGISRTICHVNVVEILSISLDVLVISSPEAFWSK